MMRRGGCAVEQVDEITALAVDSFTDERWNRLTNPAIPEIVRQMRRANLLEEETLP